MNRTVDVIAYSGFRIIDKKATVKIWEAEKILTTKKQKYYTKAIRNGTDVELVGSYLVCPFCSREFVSNTKYSACGYHWYPEKKRVLKDVIHKWSSLQISLLTDRTGSTLYFSSPINKPPVFKCPECGNVSNYSDNKIKVKLILKDDEITILSEISDVNEISEYKWLDKEKALNLLPKYEALTFNLKIGKVNIRLFDGKGEELCQREVTHHPELLYGSISHNLIKNNKIVNRNIKRMFKDIWKSDLPYSGAEIDIKHLFEMTIFVGYNKVFYAAVPYKPDSMMVDNSFKENAKIMHNAKNIVKLFENSSLPKVKSISRRFYNNPALFFYLDEAEMVWEAIKDYNLFCEFLELDNVYEILSDIHMRPGIMEYITDLCNVKGGRAFIKNAQREWQNVFLAAIDYKCSSSEVKKAIQQKWKGKGSIGRIVQRKPLYSLPMKSPEERIVDCNIDGYDFFWLRSSNEYELAGKQLNNCLATWHINDSPVVCVKKKEKYLAAIELSDGKIVQARAYNNTCIEGDALLNSAFKKWKNKYHIEWMPLSDDDDDDNEEFLLDFY